MAFTVSSRSPFVPVDAQVAAKNATLHRTLSNPQWCRGFDVQKRVEQIATASLAKVGDYVLYKDNANFRLLHAVPGDTPESDPEWAPRDLKVRNGLIEVSRRNPYSSFEEMKKSLNLQRPVLLPEKKRKQSGTISSPVERDFKRCERESTAIPTRKKHAPIQPASDEKLYDQICSPEGYDRAASLNDIVTALDQSAAGTFAVVKDGGVREFWLAYKGLPNNSYSIELIPLHVKERQLEFNNSLYHDFGSILKAYKLKYPLFLESSIRTSEGYVGVRAPFDVQTLLPALPPNPGSFFLFQCPGKPSLFGLAYVEGGKWQIRPMGTSTKEKIEVGNGGSYSSLANLKQALNLTKPIRALAPQAPAVLADETAGILNHSPFQHPVLPRPGQENHLPLERGLKVVSPVGENTY